MQKLEADRRLPDVAHAQGPESIAQGVGSECPRGDARGPQEPRPGECDAMIHAADRCKFRAGTKDQNEG